MGALLSHIEVGLTVEYFVLSMVVLCKTKCNCLCQKFKMKKFDHELWPKSFKACLLFSSLHLAVLVLAVHAAEWA